jgi:hypothetical protein
LSSSRITLLVCLLAWALPAAAQDAAQDAAGAKVDAAIAQQKKVFGPPNPRKTCGAADARGEIVVCAPDNSEHRVQSSAEVDPTSHEALYDGLPRAPQLDRGSCKGQPGCVIGGWAPPPIYYIDLKAIPEAPEGSDADLIAKGEKAER